jgi:RNA polymerase sigma-70 factor, ECF subfamily
VSSPRRLRSVGHDPPGVETDEELLAGVALGDPSAYASFYDRFAGPVFGVIRRVLRDPAGSQMVAQEVFVEVWRNATRFDASRGSARTWVLTMAHRRAIERTRPEQAGGGRTEPIDRRDRPHAYDVVAETVRSRDDDQVRGALGALTDLQREAVELTYYGGYTYLEVADLLDTPLGTIKTSMRDGLIRLRDAMGVSA